MGTQYFARAAVLLLCAIAPVTACSCNDPLQGLGDKQPAGPGPVHVGEGEGEGAQEGEGEGAAGEGEGESGTPDIEVTPTYLFFDTDVPTLTRSFVMKNVGTAPLAVSQVAWQSSPGFGWSVASTPQTPFTLPPQQTATGTVSTFLGDEAATGQVRVVSNDPDESTVYVDVEAGEAPALRASIAPAVFRCQRSGPGADIVVTLKNTGEARLLVSSVAFAAGSSADLSVDLDGATLPMRLDGNQQTTIFVHQAPRDGPGGDGTLVITSNDEASPLEIPIHIGPCTEDITTAGPFFVVRDDDGLVLHVSVSHGDGTFDAPVAIGGDVGDFGGVVIADIDGDSALDIVTSSLNGNDIRFASRDATSGLWTFSAPVALPIHMVGAGDLDDDGDVDLFGFDENNHGHVAMNDGNGVFAATLHTYDLSAVDSGYSLLLSRRAADVDGDGNADLVAVDYVSSGDGTARVSLLTGHGDGTFSAPVTVDTLPHPANGADLADVDGDGDVDLWVGLDDDGDPGQTWLLRNSGTALGTHEDAFDENAAIEGGVDQCCFGTGGLFDWNGDDIIDVLVAAYAVGFTAAQVRLHLGDNTAAFTTPTSVVAGGAAAGVGLSVPTTP